MGATKEIVLSDGKKVTVDVSTLTVKEWRNMWEPETSDEEGDKLFARLSGLKPEDIENMFRDDLKLLARTVMDLSNRPLDDPNSVSESTMD